MAPPVDNVAMEGPTHTLAVAADDLTASATCDKCGYAFIASINERGIVLNERIWLNRGDRTAAHSYMAPMDDMAAIALRATRDR